MASAGQVIYPEYRDVWITVLWGAVALMALSGWFWLRSWWQGDSDRKLEPNMRLAALAALHIPKIDEDTHFQEVVGLLVNIRQQARLDKLTVWGRKNCTIPHDHVPLSVIPPDFWEKGEIDATKFLRGGEHKRGQTGCDMLGHVMEYSDLWFDRRQAAHALPKRWPRIRLRLPFALEK